MHLKMERIEARRNFEFYDISLKYCISAGNNGLAIYSSVIVYPILFLEPNPNLKTIFLFPSHIVSTFHYMIIVKKILDEPTYGAYFLLNRNKIHIK